jgi:hypothetical protein
MQICIDVFAGICGVFCFREAENPFLFLLFQQNIKNKFALPTS